MHLTLAFQMGGYGEGIFYKSIVIFLNDIFGISHFHIKVHGANLCILTDGAAIQCGKRRELLIDGEDFFGHRYYCLTTLIPRVADHHSLAVEELSTELEGKY